jgi:hypothetical protein
MLSTNSKHASYVKRTQFAAHVMALSARGDMFISETVDTKYRVAVHAFNTIECATLSAPAISIATISLRAAHAKTNA